MSPIPSNDSRMEIFDEIPLSLHVIIFHSQPTSKSRPQPKLDVRLEERTRRVILSVLDRLLRSTRSVNRPRYWAGEECAKLALS